MPPVITKNTGLGATGAVVVNAISPAVEIPDQSLIIDMREEISMADEDESQFTTFTMKSKHSTASREKINWREKDYFPRLVTIGASFTAIASGASGPMTLTAGMGAYVRVGDVLRHMTGGNAFYVTAVAGDVLTLTRLGSAAGAGGAVSDQVLIVSNASTQGQDFPETQYLAPTFGFNYTQIFRHGCVFSRTSKAVNYYGRSEPDQEEALKGIEHKRAIEYTGFWGARDLKAGVSLPAGNTVDPVGFAGGLVEFITTNKTLVTSMAGGVLNVDNLDDWLRNVLQRASRNYCLFVSPVAAMRISKFNRGGQGTGWRPDPQTVAGLKVDAFLSGVYGYEIPIVVKKDWNDFLTTGNQYGGWIFAVDLARVEYKTLTGGSTSLLENRQHPGADKTASEWLTECTWEIRNEASHGILYGIV